MYVHDKQEQRKRITWLLVFYSMRLVCVFVWLCVFVYDSSASKWRYEVVGWCVRSINDVANPNKMRFQIGTLLREPKYEENLIDKFDQ